MSQQEHADPLGQIVQHASFEFLGRETVVDLEGKATCYRHRGTGAKLLLIENEDPQKVFLAQFMTLSRDSTGVAHILEHSVLAGSRNYQSKEPFHELGLGSLATFLNAMTGVEATTYPVASPDARDFLNLARVYLDAVFRPLLRRETFLQEGWRLDFDEAGQLTLKGIVLNEMKAAMAVPIIVLFRTIWETLYPDTEYACNSGGKPEEIPTLTLEAFRAFHARHYHPANSQLVAYGGVEAGPLLDLLAEYLDEFPAVAEPVCFSPQPPFREPRRVVGHYPSPDSETSAKAYSCVGWALAPDDTEEEFALQFLEHLLFAELSSPLRRILLSSGLGEDLCMSRIDVELSVTWAAIALSGVAEDQVEAVETLILASLRELAEQGFTSGDVAAALNQFEYKTRENRQGSVFHGLGICDQSARLLRQGRDPLSALRHAEQLERLKEKLATRPDFLQDLLRRHFTENTHRVSVFLLPDPEQSARERRREQDWLRERQAGLGAEEAARIRAEAAGLATYHQTPDPPELKAAIPHLRPAQLQARVRTLPTSVKELAGLPLLQAVIPANGLAYFTLSFDLRGLEPRLLPWLPVYCDALKGLGLEGEDYAAFDRRVAATTGGVETSHYFSPHVENGESVARLWLKGRVLADRAQRLAGVFEDMLLRCDWSNQRRLREIVLEHKGQAESMLTFMALRYAYLRLQASVHPVFMAREACEGAVQLHFLRELARRLETEPAAVEAELREVHRQLCSRQGLRLAVAAREEDLAAAARSLEPLIASLPVLGAPRQEWRQDRRLGHVAMQLETSNGASAVALFRLPAEAEGLSAACEAPTALLMHWMHEQVRQQGGAYGSGAMLNPSTGILLLLSGRDPDPAGTLRIMDHLPSRLLEAKLEREELDRFIIGACSDKLELNEPARFARNLFQYHETGLGDERRQRRWDQIRAAGPADLRTLAEHLQAAAGARRLAVAGHGDVAGILREHTGQEPRVSNLA